MKSNQTPLNSIPNKIYKEKIFYRIAHIRGSYRIGVLLAKLAEKGLEQIPDSEAEGIFDMEDWDNLIILDACRHDLYEEVMGDTDYRYTLGSSSSEYMARNFSDGDYNEVVYISANPHIHRAQFESLTGRRPENVFHEVFHTYQTDWDYEEGTVMPDSVVRDARTADKLFPEKRKIIHFMQPHHPFIGLDYDLETEGFPQDICSGDNPQNIWEHAERGKVSDEEIWIGYRKTLELVMSYVKRLEEELSGNTIVTADHGNFVGENSLYAHPEGLNAEILRKVPWDKRNFG